MCSVACVLVPLIVMCLLFVRKYVCLFGIGYMNLCAYVGMFVCVCLVACLIVCVFGCMVGCVVYVQGCVVCVHVFASVYLYVCVFG